MMKRVTFLLISLFIGASVMGQTKLNAQQQEQVLQKINVATASMKTMQCDFVQTKKIKLMKKEMVSSGVMYYDSPNKLRWQYNKPYVYVFVLNKEKVSLKSSKTTQTIDVKENKMFRQLSNIILNSVTGGHLKSSAEFEVEIWNRNNIYSALLIPKKKELKKLYKSIEISFNASLTMVETVKMVETTGDITSVTLKNAKVNLPIRESLFNVN